MSKILKVANQFAIKLAADDYQNEMWSKYYPIVTVQFFSQGEPIEGWEKPEVLTLPLKDAIKYFYENIGTSELNEITGEIVTSDFGWIECEIKNRGKRGNAYDSKKGFSNEDVVSPDRAYDILLNHLLEWFGDNFNPDLLRKGKHQ